MRRIAGGLIGSAGVLCFGDDWPVHLERLRGKGARIEFFNHTDEDDHAFWNAALQRAVNNPHLAAYVEFEKQEPERSRRRKPLGSLSYDKLKRALMTSNREYGLEMWGQKANQADLERAATDLLALNEQEDVVLLRKYLRIFRRRAFPLDPQKLIALAAQAHSGPVYGENERFTPQTRLVYSALEAVANLPLPAVRQLAFELIEGRQWISATTILLKSTMQTDDWAVLEALARETFEPYEYHGMARDIRELFEAHPETEAVQTLINLYEYGPCSACRERYVEALESIQAVPDWMREERRYDANLDLREWVNSN